MSAHAPVTVRPFTLGDDHVIHDLWRKSLPADPVDADTFAVKVLADPNFDPNGVLVAEQNGRALGFAVAMARRVPLGPDGDLEPGTGWISVFGVAPDAQRIGAGTALFDAAEGFLAASGHRRVEVAPYAPNYFWPGVDRHMYPGAQAFLRARGYRQLYEAVAMDKNLIGFSIPEDVLELKRAREAEGYEFVPLSPRYLRGLIEFNERVFYPDWTRAMRETVLRRVAWDRTLLCVREGAVLGFAQYGAYDHVPDRFGPFGVDESLRGTGLGKVLLYMTMEAIAAKGFHDTWFLWTGETTPAGYLYHRAGFTVTRTFDIFARDL